MQLEVGTLRGHTSPTTTAAFSPDGTLLATAGGDKTIRLWRAPSWEQIVAEEAKEKAESKQP